MSSSPVKRSNASLIRRPFGRYFQSVRIGLLDFVLGVSLMACNSIHFGGISPCDATNRDAPTTAERLPGEVSLISWNLHGTPDNEMASRIPRIAAMINSRHADLVLLQEVWFEGDAAALAQELSAGYERVPDPGGVRGSWWWLLKHRNGGLLVFRAKDSPWQALPGPSFIRFRTRASRWHILELDGLSAKGFQRFKVRHVKTGVTVAVLNTHLQSQYPPSESYLYQEVRRAQVLELIEMVDKASNGMPVLIAGDFNTSPKERDEPIYDVMRKLGDDLTEKLRNEYRGGTQLDSKGHEGTWIDYVFARSIVDQSIIPVSVTLIRSEGFNCPSDHHGLDVRVRVDYVR